MYRGLLGQWLIALSLPVPRQIGNPFGGLLSLLLMDSPHIYRSLICQETS